MLSSRMFDPAQRLAGSRLFRAIPFSPTVPAIPAHLQAWTRRHSECAAKAGPESQVDSDDWHVSGMQARSGGVSHRLPIFELL